MSSIANLGAASAALPQLNFHPHGHKKGAPELSTDLLSSQNTAQVPVPAVQNQFANLLRSLEQTIGLGSSSAAAAAPQDVQAAAAKLQSLAGSKVSFNA